MQRPDNPLCFNDLGLSSVVIYLQSSIFSNEIRILIFLFIKSVFELCFHVIKCLFASLSDALGEGEHSSFMSGLREKVTIGCWLKPGRRTSNMRREL